MGIAEITDVIQTEFGGDFVANLSPAIWCGSLVIQVVVETFAPQLREHYSEEGNALELDVEGAPLLFEPQPTTTTAEEAPTTPSLRKTTADLSIPPTTGTADAAQGTDDDQPVDMIWMGV